MRELTIPADIFLAFCAGAVIAIIISYFFCSLISRNREQRRYRDDDYHRGGPRTYSWFFWLFLAGGGLLTVNLASKGKIAVEQPAYNKQWTHQPTVQTPGSNVPSNSNLSGNVGTTPIAPQTPEYTPDPDEIPFPDNKPDSTPEENLPSQSPCDHCFTIQTDCLSDRNNAQRRLEALSSEFTKNRVGMYFKEIDGAETRAIVIGEFCNIEDAHKFKLTYGLRGTIIPCEGLKILSYRTR